MTINKLHRFERLTKIIGEENLLTLEKKCVLVLGCGGVGGYVCEALARSNIGTLIIVDYDIVDESNINRQIIALDSTIGQKKVDVLEKRIHDINENCKVIKIDSFMEPDNLEELFSYSFDFLVDACDTVTTKKEVIKMCLKKQIPFISSMGTGNKMDPTKLEVCDIRKTNNDPLARIIRKFVKDEKITHKVPVLCSTELPVKTGDRTPGSTAFVPPAAGLVIASYIVSYFLKK